MATLTKFRFFFFSQNFVKFVLDFKMLPSSPLVFGLEQGVRRRVTSNMCTVHCDRQGTALAQMLRKSTGFHAKLKSGIEQCK